MYHLLIVLLWVPAAVGTYFYLRRKLPHTRDDPTLIPMVIAWPITLPVGLLVGFLRTKELKERQEMLWSTKRVRLYLEHIDLDRRQW